MLLLSLRYFREGRYYQGEYYFLLLSAFLGMLTISSSRDLLMLFISLELVSAPGVPDGRASASATRGRTRPR